MGRSGPEESLAVEAAMEEEPREEWLTTLFREIETPLAVAPAPTIEKSEAKPHLEPALLEWQNADASLPQIDLDFDDEVLIEWACEEAPSAADVAQTQVDYCRHPWKKGYIFRLRVWPPKAPASRIQHNITFLIDRSNSISAARFLATKQAVAKAVMQIDEADSFNIVFFDTATHPFNAAPVAATPSNVDAALHFLHEMGEGGFFSSTDLYRSLGKIVPKVVSDGAVNSLILLSDGETILNRSEQRGAINRWRQQSKDRLSLFCVASGKRNNLAMLDLLSRLNRGQLRFVRHVDQLEQTVVQLTREIARPIGQEVSITALRPAGQGRIKLYPSSGHEPNLYAERPYELFGTTETLEEFVLFIQARHLDQWLDLRAEVAFDGPASNPSKLRHLLVQHTAYDLYLGYLNSGNGRLIDQARELLHPLNLQTAFADR